MSDYAKPRSRRWSITVWKGSGGLINPKSNTTRAEIAVLLERVIRAVIIGLSKGIIKMHEILNNQLDKWRSAVDKSIRVAAFGASSTALRPKTPAGTIGDCLFLSLRTELGPHINVINAARRKYYRICCKEFIATCFV